MTSILLGLLLAWSTLTLATTPTAAGAETPHGPLQEAGGQPELSKPLASDDECLADGSGHCATNALQRHALRRARAQAATGLPPWRSCVTYTCYAHYRPANLCHCNPGCESHQNCCEDYWTHCKSPTAPLDMPAPASPPPVRPVSPAPGPPTQPGVVPPKPIPVWPSSTLRPPPPVSGPSLYNLDWVAQGLDFFDGFTFLTEDPNHGAAQYLPRKEAQEHGVIRASETNAIVGAGLRNPKWKYKRHTAKIKTTRSWSHFLAVMKFSHVPYGCGVWPAFFTLATGHAWPNGGEVDILEYVNDDVSKTSFHSGESCKLDAYAVNELGAMPDRNNMDYECKTQYPKHLGCAPNKFMRSGEDWSKSPGMLALERTPQFLKIFYIPEAFVLSDIAAGRPQPDSWPSSFLVSYYPFAESGCSSSVMTAQQLVLNIGFCGDWASKVWKDSVQCSRMISGCRSVDPLHEYAPAEDCCTQFIYDEDGKYDTDKYLLERAFWNISFIKVFTPNL